MARCEALLARSVALSCSAARGVETAWTVTNQLIQDIITDFSHQREEDEDEDQEEDEEEQENRDRETADIEDTICELKECLENLERHLKLARTRLMIRERKHQLELCRDREHSRLLAEIEELRQTKRLFQEKIREAECFILSVK